MSAPEETTKEQGSTYRSDSVAGDVDLLVDVWSDGTLLVSIYAAGDGPSAVLRPAKARQLAADLIHRADRIDRELNATTSSPYTRNETTLMDAIAGVIWGGWHDVVLFSTRREAARAAIEVLRNRDARVAAYRRDHGDES